MTRLEEIRRHSLTNRLLPDQSAYLFGVIDLFFHIYERQQDVITDVLGDAERLRSAATTACDEPGTTDE